MTDIELLNAVEICGCERPEDIRILHLQFADALEDRSVRDDAVVAAGLRRNENEQRFSFRPLDHLARAAASQPPNPDDQLNPPNADGYQRWWFWQDAVITATQSAHDASRRDMLPPWIFNRLPPIDDGLPRGPRQDLRFYRTWLRAMMALGRAMQPCPVWETEPTGFSGYQQSVYCWYNTGTALSAGAGLSSVAFAALDLRHSSRRSDRCVGYEDFTSAIEAYMRVRHLVK